MLRYYKKRNKMILYRNKERKEHYERKNLLQCRRHCKAAGQTVFHYHVHMIPRHKDDKVGLGWTMHELTEEEKEDVLSKIK